MEILGETLSRGSMWFLFLCIFIGGLVDSIAGGGGLITLPAYYAVGIPPHMALGTNKFASSIGTLTASIRYFKEHQINFKVGIIAAVCGMIGSPLGAKLAMAIDEKYLSYVLLVAVPIIAVMILRKKDFGQAKTGADAPSAGKAMVLSAVIGLVIGSYDGFFGPGTGTFLTLLFNSVLGMGILSACGTTKLVNLSSNVAALATYALNGNVIFSIGIRCTIFAILGNWVGSGLALKNGTKIIRPIMIVIMVLLLIKVASGLF